jgi:hypothetical protein
LGSRRLPCRRSCLAMATTSPRRRCSPEDSSRSRDAAVRGEQLSPPSDSRHLTRTPVSNARRQRDLSNLVFDAIHLWRAGDLRDRQSRYPLICAGLIGSSWRHARPSTPRGEGATVGSSSDPVQALCTWSSGALTLTGRSAFSMPSLARPSTGGGSWSPTPAAGVALRGWRSGSPVTNIRPRSTSSSKPSLPPVPRLQPGGVRRDRTGSKSATATGSRRGCAREDAPAG